MAKLLKRVLTLVLFCTVAALAVYAVLLPEGQKQAGGRRAAMRAGGQAVPILAAPAKIADVPVYLDGVGTAKPRNTVTVRPQVDGRILSINFKEGQDVKRGDVLAKIDPATYQAQLDQALAKKALDEAQLANAKRDLERYAQLAANVVAQKTIDTQRALVAQLTAQVKADEAAIANAKAILDYTTIVSPIDGRTGLRLVDEGNLVRASDAGIVVITEIRPISVLFTLPQQQLTQVHRAMAAGSVSVEAIDSDGRTVDRGSLQVVDNQIDQTTGTVRMKADFPNADMQLWPGQFVNVRVLIDTLKQVVTIPTPAVQRGPTGTYAYVVQPDNRVAQRPISVGLQNERLAVVTKGIEPSDQVVTTGFARLRDGSRVLVAQPDGPEEPGTTPAASTFRPIAKGGASAAEGRGRLRTACADEIRKFCADKDRSGIRDCLRGHAADLSETCKAAAQATGGGDRSVGRPREADARKLEGSSTQ